MSYHPDELERSLANVLKKIMRKHDNIDDASFLYDIPDQHTYDPYLHSSYRAKPNVFRIYYDALRNRGPVQVLEYLLKDFVQITQYAEKVSRTETEARQRVEHWNRIESNIVNHQAVLEAWKEFRVHYKLSTGEDLPPLGDDSV